MSREYLEQITTYLNANKPSEYHMRGEVWNNGELLTLQDNCPNDCKAENTSCPLCEAITEPPIKQPYKAREDSNMNDFAQELREAADRAERGCRVCNGIMKATNIDGVCFECEQHNDTISNVELRPNNIFINSSCPYCGRRTDPGGPLDVFDKATNRILCGVCIEECLSDMDKSVLQAVHDNETRISDYYREESQKTHEVIVAECDRLLPLFALGRYKQAEDELRQLRDRYSSNSKSDDCLTF